jgi:hypothetical protein
LHSQANQTLSNLTSPTAVNITLLPNSTNTKNLGSSGLSWKNLYLRGDIYLDGARFVSNAGTGNTAIGSAVLNANTGSYNTGVGFNALKSNTTGNNNTTSGYQSLYSNSTGYSNTGFRCFSIILQHYRK